MMISLLSLEPKYSTMCGRNFTFLFLSQFHMIGVDFDTVIIMDCLS